MSHLLYGFYAQEAAEEAEDRSSDDLCSLCYLLCNSLAFLNKLHARERLRVSQGRTEAEAMVNIREAIAACLEVRAEEGMPLTVAVREVEVGV